jgi:hypothetical protein
MTDVQGSAIYVAIECVSAALHGRDGTFVLQHAGTMTRGVAQLSITVVPDSGSGELWGLSGSMIIKIEGRRHFYPLHDSGSSARPTQCSLSRRQPEPRLRLGKRKRAIGA